MHHANGKLPGGFRVDQDMILNGLVDGHAYVAGWVTLHMNGTIAGDLTVESGATVEINGTVRGALINEGGEVMVKGHVGSITDSNGATTSLASNAVVGL